MKLLAEYSFYFIVWVILTVLGVNPLSIHGNTPLGFLGAFFLALLATFAWEHLYSLYKAYND